MGQYKVPQDVESEDKLIGPLSFRQFVYVLIGLAWGGIMWRVLSFNLIIMLVVIIPVTGFFLLLGFGRRQEQSFEKYFIAAIRFFFVPRIMVWDKDLSHVEMVKPEKEKQVVVEEKRISKNSLKQLAEIMDTYGNAKNPLIQLPVENNPATQISKRIIAPSSVATVAQTKQSGYAQQPQSTPIYPNDDMLNESAPRAAQVNNMLQTKENNIYDVAVQNVQKGIKNPATINLNPNNVTKTQTPDVIIKKAMLESSNLSVAQISKQTNSQILMQGKEVKISN